MFAVTYTSVPRPFRRKSGFSLLVTLAIAMHSGVKSRHLFLTAPKRRWRNVFWRFIGSGILSVLVIWNALRAQLVLKKTQFLVLANSPTFPLTVIRTFSSHTLRVFLGSRRVVNEVSDFLRCDFLGHLVSEFPRQNSALVVNLYEDQYVFRNVGDQIPSDAKELIPHPFKTR
jgi:hypothetical protein